MAGLAVRIENAIRQFAASSENNLGKPAPEPAWAEPLVGFSRGDDPLYSRFKNDIGPFYWTPAEIFNTTFPGLAAAPEELTVISWVLPQTAATKQDNRQETSYPSERWARTRKYGEEFNMKLHDHLSGILNAAGYTAVAPSRSPAWSMQQSGRFGLSSSWSERHAAYAAGLGTFGLCDGLITPAGKAMRCGSVIARIAIPPTQRPYSDPRAYCLFFSKGACGLCIKRCPAGAVTEKGHDKEKCKNYIFTVTSPYVSSRFGFDSYGCGLCQTGVPCESAIP